MANKLTQERLKELFDYDLDNGSFTRKKTVSRFVSGTVAGFLRKDGYVQVKVDSINYLAHRLAWLYVNGVIPTGEIDHINHNRSDNGIVNLRCASRTENSRNCSATKGHKYITGVYFCPIRLKFAATISDKSKSINLGYFQNESDANKARKEAEKIYGYHSNHGQIKEC